MSNSRQNQIVFVDPRAIFTRTAGVVFLGMVLLSAGGCATSGSGNETKKDGGAKDVSKTRKQGARNEKFSQEQEREVVKSLAELMKAFSSSNPSDWKRAARNLRTYSDEHVPDVIREHVEQAQQTGVEGKQARQELVRWGELKSMVLRLPTKNEETWDDVRRRMLEEGPEGRDMFIRHMVQLLDEQTRYRRQAAKQIAKCGSEVVDRAWEQMVSLTERAKQARKQGKSVPGAMVVLEGLAKVQVYAGRWNRIRKALQHPEVRIRIAMANGLVETEDVPRAIKLLSHVVDQDDAPLVRNAAVTTLGVFKERKEAIEPLAEALRDPNPEVAKSAAGALRYFYRHERDVVRALILALKDLEKRDGRAAETHRKAIHEALKEISGESEMKNSANAWNRWYRNEYSGNVR